MMDLYYKKFQSHHKNGISLPIPQENTVVTWPSVACITGSWSFNGREHIWDHLRAFSSQYNFSPRFYTSRWVSGTLFLLTISRIVRRIHKNRHTSEFIVFSISLYGNIMDGNKWTATMECMTSKIQIYLNLLKIGFFFSIIQFKRMIYEGKMYY